MSLLATTQLITVPLHDGEKKYLRDLNVWRSLHYINYRPTEEKWIRSVYIVEGSLENQQGSCHMSERERNSMKSSQRFDFSSVSLALNPHSFCVVLDTL